MTDGKQNLKLYLQGTLKELDKLSDQIRATHDYSEQAESILCLRELVLEQMEGPAGENSLSPNHQVR